MEPKNEQPSEINLPPITVPAILGLNTDQNGAEMNTGQSGNAGAPLNPYYPAGAVQTGLLAPFPWGGENTQETPNDGGQYTPISFDDFISMMPTKPNGDPVITAADLDALFNTKEGRELITNMYFGQIASGQLAHQNMMNADQAARMADAREAEKDQARRDRVSTSFFGEQDEDDRRASDGVAGLFSQAAALGQGRSSGMRLTPGTDKKFGSRLDTSESMANFNDNMQKARGQYASQGKHSGSSIRGSVSGMNQALAELSDRQRLVSNSQNRGNGQ